MTKLIPALLTSLIIFSGTALAQSNATEDCTACRDNSFYYILLAMIIIFLVFFYLRNRAPKVALPEKKDDGDGPIQPEN